ncbi:MAG TPA: VanW family protein, partial [Gaiellaceae bacterium]|nr:VanW family protein [Gaiellaceae bacterium]
MVRRAGRFAVALAALLVVLALGLGLALAGSADRIAAGVTIAGVNVGGLGAAEAEERLGATAQRYATVPVVFTAGERRFRLTPSQIELRADWAAAAAEAVDRGRWPLPFRGLKRAWLRFSGAEIAPAVDVYESALDFRVGEIAAAVDRAPREAAIVLSGLEPEIVPGQDGRSLDREASAALVVDALSGFERSETPLPVAVAPQKVTRERLVPVAEQVRAILSGPVRLTYNGASITIRPRETARLLLLPAGGETAIGVHERAAARRLENVAQALAREPRNADFSVRADGKVRIVRSRAGRELDVAATAEGLLRAASRPGNRTAPLVVAPVEPTLTTAEARDLGVQRQLASYSTLYSGTADRIGNLQRAIDLLDGARIAPDAVWSFNERVGPRTAERGFRSAPVIMDGKYEEGIGGGVSQVATTVFNAAWEAGIKIAERTAHALYISRYPTGRDATVNYPDVDLKLRNDTGRWIVLKASYDESGIVVRLLGGGVERRVESIPGELRETGDPKVEREPDPSLYVGERVVEEDGEPARSVTVERIVYRGGEVLYREAWTTNYRSEPKIVRVGTKPRPVEPAPPPEEEKKPKDEKPSGGGGG